MTASSQTARTGQDPSVSLGIALNQEREVNTALRQAIETYKPAVMAVLQLCAGRPDTDLLTVQQILDASQYPAQQLVPLTVEWSGTVIRSGGVGNTKTWVSGTTALGGPAGLVLTETQRQEVADFLTCRTAPCTTAHCGELTEDPPLGWVMVDIAGSDHMGHWWCSSTCAQSAITRIGSELAVADQAAAVAPQDVSDETVARCVRCGCTDDTPCEGSCAWVPWGMTDLCTACATPDELAAAGPGWQLVDNTTPQPDQGDTTALRTVMPLAAAKDSTLWPWADALPDTAVDVPAVDDTTDTAAAVVEAGTEDGAL